MSITRKHTLWLVMALTVMMAGLRLTKPPSQALSWDVKGYYLYLPAAFIYDDLRIGNTAWVEEIREKYNTSATLYMLNSTESGNHVIKYTMGLSWLYAPMFFAGHAVARLLPAYPADGFSLPYQLALAMGMFIYVFLGMVLLRNILMHFLDERTTFFTILLLALGTNLLNQFAFHTLLAHSSLFFLVAALIIACIKFYGLPELRAGNGMQQHEKNGIKPYMSIPSGQVLRWLAAIALLCGMIALIRPTEAVCVLVFVFWGVGSWQTFRKRVIFFVSRPLLLIMFMLLVFLVSFPQFYYWKVLTGEWLHYSYDNPGEGLDLLAPHTLDFLFSFRKGWLIYTPMMWLAIWGFVIIYRKEKGLFTPLALLTISSIYLMSSWTTWWYAGGCFSSRTMISIYPALAIPLGFTVKSLLAYRSRMRILIWAVTGFFVFLNLFQTWQFQRGIITLETMTRPYYFRSFLRTSVSDDDKQLLLVQRPLTAYESFAGGEQYVSSSLLTASLKKEDFPDFRFDSGQEGAGVDRMVLDGTNSFSPVFEWTFRELTSSGHAWLRGQAYIYIPDDYAGPDPLLVMSFTHSDENYKYRSSERPLSSIVRGRLNVISLDYLTPEVRTRSDMLRFYVWHRGTEAVYLDSLSLEVFTRR